MPPTPHPPPLLSLQGLRKAFFGVPVLKGVDLQLRPASVLGLVGENGAGKSTLMNILGGNIPPDQGRMELDGAVFQPRSPRDAEDAGVAFVHQELNLFPNLTVGENLLLGRFPTRGPLIHPSRTARLATDALRRVGLDLDPHRPLESLAPGEQQLVEIARTLTRQPRVLILDEPTSSLSHREAARLLELVRQLRSGGLAIIYISHQLDHVLQLADDLLVLRDGERVGHGPASEFTEARLVQLMVGRPLSDLHPRRKGTPDTTPDRKSVV